MEVTFIDREVERETFHEILKFENDVRLLTIKDKGGRGKSSLLKRLQYECHFIKDIPNSLILLDEIPSGFDLVKTIRVDLKKFENLKFTKFDILDNARMLKDPNPFSDSLRDGSGMVNAEKAEIKDQAIVAARIDTIIQNAEKVVLKQRDKWPSEDYEAFVREYCVAAFFEDLKIMCKERSIVILLDAWEKCEAKLQQWILRPMLHNNCFRIPERPFRLVFVLAGRQIPPLKERLESEYPNLVVSRDKLSEWSIEHMEEFLKAHGFTGLTREEIKTICERVNHEKSLDWALSVARAYIS
jgi:hypothetical protein